MKRENKLVKLAEKNGWTVAEIAQLRWELWGQIYLPDNFRGELPLPSTIREGIQMLIGEDWDRIAEPHLAKPPYRDGSRNPNEMPVGVA
jgi:hypothetical protein